MNACIAIVALLAALCASAQAAPADKVDCSKLDEVMDESGLAQGMTTLSDKYKLSVNLDEFKKRCTEMEDAVKTLKKFNKECYSSLTQQVFSAILRTRSQMNDLYCKGSDEQAMLAVEASKCLLENSLKEAQVAEKKTTLGSELILAANISDDKMRMRRSCCAVLASKGLFLDAVRPKCAKHEKIYADYVDSYTSESMSLICEDADKLKCAELEPFKMEGVEPKARFFLSPMLKLVKSLDH